MAVISVLGEEVRQQQSQPGVAGASRAAFRSDRNVSFLVNSEESSLNSVAFNADEGSLPLWKSSSFYFLYASKLGKVKIFLSAKRKLLCFGSICICM